MGVLKNMRDQLFRVPKVTRALCYDNGFLSRSGLDSLPPEFREQQLRPRVGFVFAMYRTAEDIFDKAADSPEDDKLTALLYSRYRMLSHVREPHLLAAAHLLEVKEETAEWHQLTLKQKLFEVVARAFVEEEKTNAPSPAFADDTMAKMICGSLIRTLLPEVLPHVECRI